MTKLLWIVKIIILCGIVSIVNCQYFSSNDGVYLPRSGKRSFNLGDLVKLQRNQNENVNNKYEQHENFYLSSRLNDKIAQDLAKNQQFYKNLVNKLVVNFLLKNYLDEQTENESVNNDLNQSEMSNN